LFAQDPIIKGFVLDSLSMPISYANVYSEMEEGAYTNQNGYFEIKLTKKPRYLIFSSIGYVTDSLLLHDSMFTDTLLIKLQYAAYALEEVAIISPKKYANAGHTKKYGHFDGKENNHLNVNAGHILAYYFENMDGNIGTLEYVKFRLGKTKNKPKVRINIYTAEIDPFGNASPGQLCYQSEVLLLSTLDKIITVNLPTDRLFFDKDGLFAAVELLSGGEYTSKTTKFELNYPSFMMTEKEKKHLTWKSYMGSKWRKLNTVSRKNHNPWNLKVELKVRY
jgi:hypothetical protein